MTAPPITTRALTFEFASSVTSTGLPNILEIALTPLDVGNDASADISYVGGTQVQTLELSQPTNTVSFDLVPTASPGLDVPINYRVMWRIGITGATATFDFAMPDSDLTWAQLIAGPGNIINGETYLQQTDLGVANRVAQLNSSGIPETSTGTAVALSTDITTLTTNLASEVTNRTSAITALTTSVSTQVANSASSTLSTAETYTNTKFTTAGNNLASEAAARASADTGLQGQITANLASLTDDIDSVVATTGGNTTALDLKANLVDGIVPTNELPAGIVTTAVTAANQTAMLALTGSQVAPGDICVRPDGTFLLNAAPASTLSNWQALSQVISVNGKQGALTLAASDVSAVAVGASITQSQVTGLSTALSNLASTSALTALSSTVSTILNDTSYVHTTSGTIPNAKLNTGVVTYNGTTLSTVGGTDIPINEESVSSVNGQTGTVTLTAAQVGAMATGASVTQSQVTGLSTALGNKADLVSGTVPLSELPSLPITQITGLSTALSNCAQLTSGLISLSNIPNIPQSQVTGLPAILTSNGLTSSTTAMATIAAIQTALATKADLTSGVLSASEIPTNIPQSSITGLTTALSNCATLTGTGNTVIPLSQTPQNIPQSYISGLSATLAAKADLAAGVVPVAQLPALNLPNIQVVANTTALTALTTAQVGPGTLALVTGGAGQGTYILQSGSPATLSNWTLLPTPNAAVSSVNGHTGAVTLAASDVSAIPVGGSITQSQVTGLVSALAALPGTYATQTALNALPTFTALQNYLASAGTKRVDYVATTALPSLSGQQTVDGILIPTGARVLVTAQASSTQNGLWVSSGSSWTRPADYASTFYVAQGALVIVTNQSAGSNGVAHNGTMWQQSGAGGIIDTSASSWVLTGYVDAPFAPIQGNGINISGSTFTAKVATGGGLQVSSSGLGVNRATTPQFFSGILPASSTSTLTHNLNNPFPQVTIWDNSVSPPQIVLAPVQATTANEITVYFQNTPASNQYWCTLVG